MREERPNVTATRSNYMYWELLHGLEDLESDTFREHWYYRAALFRIHSNADINPFRRKQYEHLLEQAREYRRERAI